MTITVVLNDNRNRYEVKVGGRVAGFAEFHDRMGVRVFHTAEVTPEFVGHGLSTTMIGMVLDLERAAGHRIRSRAPFLNRFIERHPEYRDLLAPSAAPRPRATSGSSTEQASKHAAATTKS